MYADEIKKIMKSQGLTMKSLAAKMGVSQPNLSALLSGKRSPRLASLEPVAKALGVRVADFLEPSDKHDFFAMIKTESAFYTAESVAELKQLIPFIENGKD